MQFRVIEEHKNLKTICLNIIISGFMTQNLKEEINKICISQNNFVIYISYKEAISTFVK